MYLNKNLLIQNEVRVAIFEITIKTNILYFHLADSILHASQYTSFCKSFKTRVLIATHPALRHNASRICMSHAARKGDEIELIALLFATTLAMKRLCRLVAPLTIEFSVNFIYFSKRKYGIKKKKKTLLRFSIKINSIIGEMRCFQFFFDP